MKLMEVTDPEIGLPITEMKLVDEIKVEEGRAHITYHLSAPFCPPQFALYIGREIKKMALEVEGITDVEVTVRDHINAEEINKSLKE